MIVGDMIPKPKELLSHGREILGLELGFAIVAASILGGCGPHRTYSGPPRPPDQIAIVEGVDNGGQCKCIVGINGVDFRGTFSQVFELEPGGYRLAVKYSDGVWVRTQSVEPCDVKFVAEAGHRYVVEAGHGSHGWWALLRDRNTGQEFPCDQRLPVYLK